MRRAISSVLAQDVPEGWRLEVVVAVSDPRERADLAAAEEAARDQRVVVAHGPGTTAGATRNAGLRRAAGEVVAFLDDDCEARPGWLAEMLAALTSADLAQGRTVPAFDPPPMWRTISIEPLTWLWEACNLAVRRDLVDRTAVFDEGWDATGRVDLPFGEDADWGWQLVRGGARYAAASNAVVEHVVEPRGLGAYLEHVARLRLFPRLIRKAPEVRRIFYGGYFVGRRHAELAAVTALSAGALAARATQRRRLAVTMGVTAAALYARPLGGELRRRPLSKSLKLSALRTVTEVVELGACVYGSVRWRRLLL